VDVAEDGGQAWPWARRPLRPGADGPADARPGRRAGHAALRRLMAPPACPSSP
jgi:hypothetical protein